MKKSYNVCGYCKTSKHAWFFGLDCFLSYPFTVFSEPNLHPKRSQLESENKSHKQKCISERTDLSCIDFQFSKFSNSLSISFALVEVREMKSETRDELLALYRPSGGQRKTLREGN